jgi:hypothetical protein
VATVVVDTPGPDPALVGRLILASLRMMGTFPATLFDPGPVSMPVTDRADAERIGALLTAAGATVHIEHPAGRR